MTIAAPAKPAPPGLDALRRADWLTGRRATAYGWILLVVSAAVAAGWALASHGGLDPTGKPLGTDFKEFWAASKLAGAGAPRLVYDWGPLHDEQIAMFGRDTGFAPFFYPPIFLLVCLPLAAVPYLVALPAWLLVTGAAYWRAAKAWLGARAGSMPIFAFPAVLANAGHGQNGFLSAALFGFGAFWLERRPVIAGLCLGSLAYKPHLGLIIPIALAISRRWSSFIGAAAAVLLLSFASWAVYGLGTWQAFIAASSLAQNALNQGAAGDAKLQSAFAAARVWGGPLALAWTAQAAMAVFAVGGLVWLRRRAPSSEAAGPAMIVAALLSSPYLFDYDLVILAAPLAWLFRQGIQRGFLDWEKTILAAAFVLPAVSRTLATEAKLPLAPLVIAALFVLVLRRGVYELHGANRTCAAFSPPLAS